jgi:hypothetical protein
MNRQALQDLINENSVLFWSVSKEDLVKLSPEVVVETFLNYADINQIKKMIEIIGIKRVAEIFHNQIKNARVNYHKQTINFFTLYFNRHAQKSSVT